MYTSINGLKLNFEVIGKGEPILLLHGWGGSIASLSPLANRLASCLKVILLDLPGFGKSESPQKDFCLDDYAEVLEEFLKKQGIKEVYIFGHSFGGAVAIKLAVRRNIQLKKLILCNASGIRKPAAISHQLSALPKIGKRLSKIPVVKGVYFFFRKFFYYYILHNRDYIDYQEIAGTFRKVIAEDLTPILKEVKVPTLLLWGEEDKDTPVSHAKIMKLKIEDSPELVEGKVRLKIFKGIGHGLPKFRSDLLVDDIVEFLKS
ncbi:alpha/beta hydrolase [Candidatus Dojkabacteria bacterium]|nr:alpha/beta hydrolase [Candidatus Dojkabacteria bacterium]